MNVTVTYEKGVQFTVLAGTHRIVCDQPLEHGGENQGPTPPEFLLASLGTCVGYYALQYLKLRSLPTDDLTVTVSAEKAKQPARLADFKVEVFAGELQQKDIEGVTRAASACLIHNTLNSFPAISVVVHAANPAAVTAFT